MALTRPDPESEEGIEEENDATWAEDEDTGEEDMDGEEGDAEMNGTEEQFGHSRIQTQSRGPHKFNIRLNFKDIETVLKITAGEDNAPEGWFDPQTQPRGPRKFNIRLNFKDIETVLKITDGEENAPEGWFDTQTQPNGPHKFNIRLPFKDIRTVLNITDGEDNAPEGWFDTDTTPKFVKNPILDTNDDHERSEKRPKRQGNHLESEGPSEPQNEEPPCHPSGHNIDTEMVDNHQQKHIQRTNDAAKDPFARSARQSVLDLSVSEEHQDKEESGLDSSFNGSQNKEGERRLGSSNLKTEQFEEASMEEQFERVSMEEQFEEVSMEEQFEQASLEEQFEEVSMEEQFEEASMEEQFEEASMDEQFEEARKETLEPENGGEEVSESEGYYLL